MSDEEFLSYQKKLVAWFVAALASSVGLNQGIQMVKPVRYDAFTGTEAQFLEQRVMFYCDKKEAGIRNDMPPICTRRRILNIERYMEHNFPEFDRSEFCW